MGFQTNRVFHGDSKCRALQPEKKTSDRVGGALLVVAVPCCNSLRIEEEQ